MEAKDLVKVIEACGKTGVSCFKMGEIEITFNGFVFHSEKDYPMKIEGAKEGIQSDPNFGIQQEYEEAQFDVENKALIDPLGYEEDLYREHLEDSESMEDYEGNQ